MNILNNLVFVAFLISIMYFIIKHFIFKIDKNKDKPSLDYYKKNTFKDSILVFILSYCVLYSKKYLLDNELIQTKIFTNEPNF